jgi:tRNA (guanine10-N2)-dimethyltransferase
MPSTTRIFLLSKQQPELAKEEVLSLLDTNLYKQFDNLLITEDNTGIRAEERLGYTHAIYSFLFEAKKQDFRMKVKSFDWTTVYRNSFSVRVHNTKEYEEGDIAKIIFHKLQKPVVNLSSPQTQIEFFFKDETVIAGLLRSKVDKSYLTRRAHLRPSLHPTSLHPALSRACINLTGLTSGSILDPFCGSGGILIEAGIMGFDIAGYDLDREQIKRARKNLEHYKIRNYRLSQGDARNLELNADAIVTDLPYGKSSKAKDIEKLYTQFLKSAQAKKMVVIFPDFVKHRELINLSNYKIVAEFRIYVHKSLSRNVVTLALSH